VSNLRKLTVHHHKEWNKIVYVLGEEHSEKDGCPKGPASMDGKDFVFKMVNSTPELVDVFIEESLDPTQTKEHRYDFSLDTALGLRMAHDASTLSRVSATLADSKCLGRTKDLCTMFREHVRFHLTDIRDATSPAMRYVNALYETLLSRIDDSPAEKAPSIAEFRRYTSKDTLRRALNDFFRSSKIERQLSRIPDKYAAAKTELVKRMNEILDVASRELTYDKVKAALRSDDEDTLLDLFEVVLGTFVAFMDIYLLSRLFRQFRNIRGVPSEEPRNIIIVVGNEHATSYRKLLRQLGFKTVFSSKLVRGKPNCIEVKGLRLKWLPPQEV
jgi:hypothetical protein